MKASVIICTYNRAELLKESIQSVLEQDFQLGQFELVVVDNNSTDETEKIVKAVASSSMARIRYLFEGRQGLSFARNAGIKGANGEIIVFIDDDVEAEKTWLREMVSVFNNPDVVCAGGPVLPLWPSEKPDWLKGRFLDYLSVNEFKYARQYGEFKEENSYPIGANMAFRKTIFETIGMFPTNLGRVGYSLLSNNELLPFIKIRAINKCIPFVPNAVIHHKIAPERLKKPWFYHRVYWQGRSDAILDMNMKANVYDRLRQHASAMMRRKMENKEDDFEDKCLNRLVKGYLHQLVLSQDEHIENSFRRLRSLEEFVTEIMKTSAEQCSDKIRQAEEFVAEIMKTSTEEYSDKIRQRDKQLGQLVSSLSWRITAPFRIIHRLFAKPE